MSGIPLCANPKCQRPMPNWIGAIGFESTSCPAVCRKCFGKLLTDVPDRARVSVKLDQRLLELIETKDSRLKSVACLAIQSSIPMADAYGIFSDPTGLLKKALKALYPELGYGYNLLQTARRLLIKGELWLPQGRQLTGKKSKENKMRLGEKIRPFRALR